MNDNITAERLAEIRARTDTSSSRWYRTDVPVLLAAIDARDEEIERLRGEPTDAEVEAAHIGWMRSYSERGDSVEPPEHIRAALTAAREVRHG